MKRIYIRGDFINHLKNYFFLFSFHSFVQKLLTKKNQTKEAVQNELIEVFGPESQNVHKFLDWLWNFLESNQTKVQITKKIESHEKTEQIGSQKPQKLTKKNTYLVQQPKLPLKKNINNNVNIKNDEMQTHSEQTKDKKSILDRIKKPKNIQMLKKNLTRPAAPLNNNNNNHEIKEKIIEKKIKTEAVPTKNM